MPKSTGTKSQPPATDRLGAEARGLPLQDRLRALTVRSAMTTAVVSVAPQATLGDAARTMRQHHVSGLPVVSDGDRVVGLISEKDIVADLDRAAGIGKVRGILDLVLELSGGLSSGRLEQSIRRLDQGKVQEAMTSRVVTIDPDTSLSEAARVLRRFSISRLPVLEGEKLVGILTRQNIVEAIGA